MNKKITIKQYLDKNLSLNTAANYHYTINHFLKLHPKAKRYKFQQMVGYMEEVTKQYSNIQTRIRILSAIKKYYDYLVYTEQRQDHPCQTLTVRKGGNNSIQLQDLFTGEELKGLLKRENRYKYLDNRNNVLLSFLIYQGLTSDEIIRLNLEDIDLDATTIYIKASGKLNRRTLKLVAEQIRPLEKYINETRPRLLRGKTDTLLLNKLGHPIITSTINSILEPLSVLYPDRKLNPRAIRMSVISNWLNEKKLPIETVQEHAGHKWPSTTEKYLKTDNLKQVELINKYFPI